jgi:hypothetical protein
MQVAAKTEIKSYSIENISVEDMTLIRSAVQAQREFHNNRARTMAVDEWAQRKEEGLKTKYDSLLISLSDASAVYKQ